MNALHYVRRDWIIERRDTAGEWEPYPTYNPMTRNRMETAVEQFAVTNPSDEIRGHNIAHCACHPTAFKRGAAR
jgi:hypothetical protein